MLKIAYWFSTIGMIVMFLVVRHDCMKRIKAIFEAGYKMKPIAQTVGGRISTYAKLVFAIFTPAINTIFFLFFTFGYDEMIERVFAEVDKRRIPINEQKGEY